MEASPSLSVTESKAGFDEKEMTSLRNRFWPSSSLISIYTIFPQQPPQSMLHVSGDWKGLEKNFKPRHGPTLSVSQDLETETLPRQDGDGGLSFTHSRDPT